MIPELRRIYTTPGYVYVFSTAIAIMSSVSLIKISFVVWLLLYMLLMAVSASSALIVVKTSKSYRWHFLKFWACALLITSPILLLMWTIMGLDMNFMMRKLVAVLVAELLIISLATAVVVGYQKATARV